MGAENGSQSRPTQEVTPQRIPVAERFPDLAQFPEQVQVPEEIAAPEPPVEGVAEPATEGAAESASPAPSLASDEVSEPTSAEPTPAEPSQAQTPELPLDLVFVDQSRDAYDRARDIADARLDKEIHEGGRLRRFVNGVWKGNAARDYYRQKYIGQEVEKMQDAGTIHTDESTDRRAAALNATIDRFSTDYEELIHTDAGERREVKANDDALTSGVKHLIKEFANGQLSEEALLEERTRLFNEYRRENGSDTIGEGIVTSDNLIQIARAVAGMADHDDAISRIRIITGEARDGVRTEARYNATDKIIEKMKKTKVGTVVTPATLATSISIAGSIARAGSHSVVGAAMKTLVPGAAAGLWAGLRENRRLKDERAQHAREMAANDGEIVEGSRRREEIEETRYETISAKSLTDELRQISDRQALEHGGEDAVQAALDSLANIEARIQLSDQEGIDLITYSSRSQVGHERMYLDLARHIARQSLEEFELGQHPDITQPREELTAAIGRSLDQRAEVFKEILKNGEAGISEKDKAFAKLKRRRVAAAAATGVLTGVVAGALAQEVVASVDPTRVGLIDVLRHSNVAPLKSDGEVHQTLLAGFVRGHETASHVDPSSVYEKYNMGTHGSVEVSNDHALVTNANGTMELVDKNGHVTIDGLKTDSDGAFDKASLDKLNHAGMSVVDSSSTETETKVISKMVTPEQFVAQHADNATHVTRDFWYDNNTSSVYDQNELRLYTGGSAEHPGITDTGYQYTVAGMHTEGSWAGGENVDWNEASKSGNLFVAVSGTYDSQGNPFMVPIGPDGSINIDADSPAGQFFSEKGGAVSFNGAYMEVVQTSGVDTDGTVHIRPLATLVGDNSVGNIETKVTQEISHRVPEYTITTAGYDTVEHNFTEMAPVIPITPRRPLEMLARERQESVYGYYDGYRRDERYREESEIEARRKEVSPRLQKNPNAELSLGEESLWFREKLTDRRGPGYVKETERIIADNAELSSLADNVEAIVTIPVAAAHESDNIYNTLSLYAGQDPESLEKTRILLNVNQLDTVKNNAEKQALAQKTRDEIDRARRDFPQLKIATIEHEYNTAEVEKTGGVIGYVADDLVNTALLSITAAIQKGAMSPAHEVMIIRNDADSKGMSPHYIRSILRAKEGTPTADIIKGKTQYGTEYFKAFPEYRVIASMMSGFQTMAAAWGTWHTGGANFAVKASTLSAIDGTGSLIVDGEKFTGAGSDDIFIGRRIRAARTSEYGSENGVTDEDYGYSGGGNSVNSADVTSTSKDTQVKRTRYAASAIIDTNADRLVAAYQRGDNPQLVWNPDRPGNFADGEAGYRDRGEDVSSEKGKRAKARELLDVFEKSLNFESAGMPDASFRRIMGILFFGAPSGSYTVDWRDDRREIKLTRAGRRYILQRDKTFWNKRPGPKLLRV